MAIYCVQVGSLSAPFSHLVFVWHGLALRNCGLSTTPSCSKLPAVCPPATWLLCFSNSPRSHLWNRSIDKSCSFRQEISTYHLLLVNITEPLVLMPSLLRNSSLSWILLLQALKDLPFRAFSWDIPCIRTVLYSRPFQYHESSFFLSVIALGHSKQYKNYLSSECKQLFMVFITLALTSALE